MLAATTLDAPRRTAPALSLAPGQVVVQFESEAALGRALALARRETWVAECRVEPSTRTLTLRLCSGAAPAPLRLH
jgi:hypothetical protein